MKPISRRDALGALGAGALSLSLPFPAAGQGARMQSWPLGTPSRTGIHDVAPAPGGGVWFTAQRSGHLGHFDPKTGKSELIGLGMGSSPHGVIQGPDHAAWPAEDLADVGRGTRVLEALEPLAVRIEAIGDVARPFREPHLVALVRGVAARKRHRAHHGDSHLRRTRRCTRRAA